MMMQFRNGFFTFVLKKSGGYWVALCLENGLIGQGKTKDEAIIKLKEAIDSLEDARQEDPEIYMAPISINELHEFLSIPAEEPVPEFFELRAIHA
jgi:predicted RNase H-like HicB family nuclease